MDIKQEVLSDGEDDCNGLFDIIDVDENNIKVECKSEPCDGSVRSEYENVKLALNSSNTDGEFDDTRSGPYVYYPHEEEILRKKREEVKVKIVLQCTYCFKQFPSQSYLTKHERKHTKEKPFECGTCMKMFTQASGLRIHQRLHTGEKPYECEFCFKKFPRPNDLKIHRRTHTGEKPYECGVCMKTFAQWSTLKLHEQTHSGKRPHKCDLCSKTFYRARGLMIHKRSHTGEKPYECQLCGARFSQSSGLQYHIQKVCKANKVIDESEAILGK